MLLKGVPDNEKFRCDEESGLWVPCCDTDKPIRIDEIVHGISFLPAKTIHIPGDDEVINEAKVGVVEDVNFASILRGDAVMPDYQAIQSHVPSGMKSHLATQDLLYGTISSYLDKFTSGIYASRARQLFERCLGVDGSNPYSAEEREGLESFSIENNSDFIAFVRIILGVLDSKAALSARQSVLKMLFHLQSFTEGMDWTPLISDFIQCLDTDDVETAYFFEHILKVNYEIITQDKAVIILEILQSQHRVSADLGQLLLDRFPILLNRFCTEISYAELSLAQITENLIPPTNRAMNETGVIDKQSSLACADNRKVTFQSIEEIDEMPKAWRNQIWDLESLTFRDGSKKAMLERAKVLLTTATEFDKGDSLLRRLEILWHCSRSSMGLEIEVKLQGANQNRDHESLIQSSIIHQCEEVDLGVDSDAGVAELRSGMQCGIPVDRDHFINVVYFTANLEACPDLVNIASNHHHVTVSQKMIDEIFVVPFHGLGPKKTVAAFKYKNNQYSGGGYTLESKSSPLAIGTNNAFVGEIPYFFETTRYLDQFFLLEALKTFAVDDFEANDFLLNIDNAFMQRLRDNPQMCLSFLYERTDQQDLLVRVYLYCVRKANREDLVPLVLRLRKDNLLPDISHKLRIDLWRHVKQGEQKTEIELDPANVITSIQELDHADGLVWYDRIRLKERFAGKLTFEDIKAILANESQSVFIRLLLIEVMQSLSFDDSYLELKDFLLRGDIDPLVRAKIVDKLYYVLERQGLELIKTPNIPFQIRIGLIIKISDQVSLPGGLASHINPTPEELRYLLKVKSSCDPRTNISNAHCYIISELLKGIQDISFEDFFPLVIDPKIKSSFKEDLIRKLGPLSEDQKSRLCTYGKSLAPSIDSYRIGEAIKVIVANAA